jgi:hypothetical protein
MAASTASTAPAAPALWQASGEFATSFASTWPPRNCTYASAWCLSSAATTASTASTATAAARAVGPASLASSSATNPCICTAASPVCSRIIVTTVVQHCVTLCTSASEVCSAVAMLCADGRVARRKSERRKSELAASLRAPCGCASGSAPTHHKQRSGDTRLRCGVGCASRQRAWRTCSVRERRAQPGRGRAARGGSAQETRAQRSAGLSERRSERCGSGLHTTRQRAPPAQRSATG